MTTACILFIILIVLVPTAITCLVLSIIFYRKYKKTYQELEYYKQFFPFSKNTIIQ